MAKIKDLIGTSPETLDTLKEIADALGEDPDFAANVWNKISELTTKHNEDVQELQNAITSGFENIDFTPYVNKTDVVTDTTNGLMLAADKVKLDTIEEGAQVNKIESVSVNGTPLEITDKGVNIPNATTEKDGTMSKEDKDKLDNLVCDSLESDRGDLALSAK